MNTNRWTQLSVFFDWSSAFLSWFLFYYLRKIVVEQVEFSIDKSFIIGLLIIPFCWILLYYLQGSYHEIKRMYRLKSIGLTISASLIGNTFIFFALILDDEVKNYTSYYLSAGILFSAHFLSTLLPRIVISTLIINQLSKEGKGFRTLLVGGGEKAIELYAELMLLPKKVNHFVGFVNLNGVDKKLEKDLPYLGHAEQIEWVIKNEAIEEVIIALESTEHDKLKNLIGKIENGSTRIKILPDMYDIVSGSLRINNIFGALLIEINPEIMSFWQQAVKRFMDIILSIIAFILCIPLYILSAILVKLSSPGPIFYLQERIGLNGKPFKIIKFRTMYENSERTGPQLSSENDNRITPIGRFMRKTRLDEFPQFINVLKGDMALVGPRPERQFYIDQIAQIDPQFLHLTKVRPGITSWGQVKFGYAENVEQMLLRMKYDLIYLKNRSLALDIKILFYTVLIVLKAKGK
jgi:exopolysaccharide biosynthesis polyprenyl glycosylphosphotransferase